MFHGSGLEVVADCRWAYGIQQLGGKTLRRGVVCVCVREHPPRFETLQTPLKPKALLLANSCASHHVPFGVAISPPSTVETLSNKLPKLDSLSAASQDI